MFFKIQGSETMSLSNIVLPKPTNWQDFERIIRDLFECVLGDPDTQLNGRSGQPQHGVDVYGYRNQQTDYLVGVQCKKKLDDKVTEKELRDEVNKAKNFTPEISQFILVTTAPRDQKIQETARIITKELAETQHPIKVYVWGWQDIQEHAAKYEKAWKAFDPTWNPLLESAIKKLSDKVENGFKLMNQKDISNNTSSSPTKVNLDDNEDTPLHGQITAFQHLIDEGEVHTAHKQFLKLKEEVWSDASPSEKYRILVGIASAKLQIVNHEEAGHLLLDAYNEYPEHKNANKNKAAGHLLIGDDRKAEEISYKIMIENKDPYVAGIFIQSQINNAECKNPLSQIPDGLHESEDVFNAYIHFLRMRDNSDWLEYAKKAYEKYPDNKMLEKVYAESVLFRFINYDRDAIVGGIFKETNYNELNKAIEILYQIVKESLNNGLLLLPETAYNASLVLRITDDDERAKEILDNSIIEYPGNEMLLFQRALIAYAENDLEGAKDLLAKDSSNLEIINLKAIIYSELGEIEDALSLIDKIKGKELSEHIKADVLRVHVKAYIDEGKISTAIKMINEEIEHEPSNFMYRDLLIRTYYNIGENDKANKALNEAVEIVDERTSLYSRLGLSMEAQILGRNSVIIELLKDKVATDRDSRGLRLLLETLIESGHWATARKYFDLASDNLENKKWFLRAKAFFSLKTGYNKQDDILSQYLRKYPNDINMILAQIGNWQRTGRVIEIRRFLKKLNLSDLEGSPEKKANLATIIFYYGEVIRGLEYAYTLLMNNWSNFNVHLIYQSLIFLNNDIEEVIPSADTVKDKTVVCILSEGKEKRYRIDNNKYVNFEDERINPDDDLGKLLYGKHLGDEFKLNKKIHSKNVKIKWIKSIYLDAFHMSLEQFNERFPRADGLQRFSFDINSEDPIKDMRSIIRERAEANQHILEEYRIKGIPLSFVGFFTGNDPIDVWQGLSNVNINFLVSKGSYSERDKALQNIHKHNNKGCILDAITLSIVRRLGITEAVKSVCGPIYTTKSVVDLLGFRLFTAEQNIGKEMGYMVWQDNRLVYEKYSEEMLYKIAEERKKELVWASENVVSAPTLPKNDLSKEVKRIIDLVGIDKCDPAIASEGNDLLLLSEDMGFRIWSEANFDIVSTWLQPVLIKARDNNYISIDKYCEVINSLTLMGHTYISLDPNCLVYQARKDNFSVSKELHYLLSTVGGPTADLLNNSGVLSAFIDMLWQECTDGLKIKKIISEVFSTFIKGRTEDQRTIIQLLLNRINNQREVMFSYACQWKIGHSLGMSYYNELLKLNYEN